MTDELDGLREDVSRLRTLFRQEREISAGLRAALTRAWAQLPPLKLAGIEDGTRIETLPAACRRTAHLLELGRRELKLIHGLGLGEAPRATVWSAVLAVDEAQRLFVLAQKTPPLNQLLEGP